MCPPNKAGPDGTHAATRALTTYQEVASPMIPNLTPDPPETTLAETASAAATDFRELAGALPGDPFRTAQVADRLAEEAAEVAAMIRALPARPAEMSGSDRALLAALRTAHGRGEDIGETVARGLARLAAGLGSSAAVTAARPGSWESEAIARLLASTVGPDDEDLDRYRTTP